MHPRAKNYLILLLAFSTATAGALAWRQAQKIKQLQASLIATSTAPTPRKPVAHWSDATTAPKAKTTAESDETADDTADTQASRQRRNNRPDLTALMANPAFAKAWNTEQRARIDARYAALFKKLNLSPEQQTALTNLLLERQNSARDVFAAAREQGLNPGQNRDDLRKMVSDAQSEVDQSIKTTLGDAAYQQYQNYENTQSQRAVVSQLNQTLGALSTPLTTAQSDFLVQALSTPTTDATAQSNQGGGPWGRGGATITDAVIEQAQNVLSPTQVDALRQLQVQQQAQQTIRQMMRAGGGRGGQPPGN